MKLGKKDLLILFIPVLLMLIATPFLPDRIPMQFNTKGEVNWYLDKKLAFLLGLFPYVIYKLQQMKHGKN